MENKTASYGAFWDLDVNIIITKTQIYDPYVQFMDECVITSAITML